MTTSSRVYAIVILFGLGMAFDARRVDAADLEQIVKLTASDGAADHEFGTSVALSGSVSISGAPYADGNAGAAYVHRLDGAAGSGEQRLTLPDAHANDLLGFRVALDGDVAVVTAVGRDSFTGAACVFRFDGSSWMLEQELTPSDGVAGDFFGVASDVQGDVAVITRFPTGSDFGAAYVYRFDGESWIEVQKLTPSDGEVNGSFGASVAIDGDVIVVGAWSSTSPPGAAYAYRFDGSAWIEEEKITPSEPESDFGTSVDLEGDTLVVGGSQTSSAVGTVYVFEFDGSSWTEHHQVTTSDAEEGSRFGDSVCVLGTTLIVGAPRDLEDRGSAFVYRFDGTTWAAEQKLTADDGEVDDAFGESVSLSVGTALVSARRDDSDRGAAYVFFGGCSEGTVNSGAGAVTDNLYINGNSGDVMRRVDVSADHLLLASLIAPAAGGNGKFVLHADVGEPVPGSQALLPFDIGITCFPFLSTAGAAPVLVANNLGKTGLLGESEFYGSPQADPERATTHVLYPALPVGTVLTFQAVMVDTGSAGSKAVSTTNAVIVTVVP